MQEKTEINELLQRIEAEVHQLRADIGDLAVLAARTHGRRPELVRMTEAADRPEEKPKLIGEVTPV